MIEKKHKEIAHRAIEIALNKGCSSARISFLTGVNNSLEYRDTQLDKLQQNTENKLFIELFVEGKYGSFSTNRLNDLELKNFISEAIISTRFLAADLCRQLPPSNRYYKGVTEDLELSDSTYFDHSTEAKIEILKESVEEIKGTNSQIVSIAAMFEDGIAAEYMIASNGFEGENQDTAYSLSVEVALKTKGDARPESYWYDSRILWEDLQKTNIARKALERALRKIGQKKVKSGKYSMLIDNTVSSRLLSPLVSAMYGSVLQQKNSFLLDKIGEKIISDKLTLIDCPHILGAFGARYFDGEGIATIERQIIENGVLRSYFIDTYNSLKMQLEPTISSPSILIVKSGNKPFEQIMSTLDKGIWITGFNGGNCNGTTGDFSFGVEGFLIENGVVTQPISEMNITGNMLSLWNNLTEIGNDPRPNSSWRVPSLLFHEVTFSGL